MRKTDDELLELLTNIAKMLEGLDMQQGFIILFNLFSQILTPALRDKQINKNHIEKLKEEVCEILDGILKQHEQVEEILRHHNEKRG